MRFLINFRVTDQMSRTLRYQILHHVIQKENYICPKDPCQFNIEVMWQFFFHSNTLLFSLKGHSASAQWIRMWGYHQSTCISVQKCIVNVLSSIWAVQSLPHQIAFDDHCTHSWLKYLICGHNIARYSNNEYLCPETAPPGRYHVFSCPSRETSYWLNLSIYLIVTLQLPSWMWQ